MPRSKRHRASADELAMIEARREARMGGMEFRPTTAKKVEEAERLNRGLSMLEEDGNEGETGED